MSTYDELVHVNYQLNQCLEEIRKVSDLPYEASVDQLWMAIGRIEELLDHYVPLSEEPESSDPTIDSLNDIPF